MRGNKGSNQGNKAGHHGRKPPMLPYPSDSIVLMVVATASASLILGTLVMIKVGVLHLLTSSQSSA